jgi:Uma2 family endonuclease
MTDMALALELKTVDDLLAMPDDGHRYELIFGEIVTSPSPRTKHQVVIGRLFREMEEIIEPHRLGVLFLSPLDVRISRHNMVQPDLFFIGRERLGIVTDERIEGPPDLAVEVLSPSNRSQDLVKKAFLYASNGVTEYWIVDPENELIAVNTLVDGQYVAKPFENGAAASSVLPGFSVRPDELFRTEPWIGSDVTDS